MTRVKTECVNRVRAEYLIKVRAQCVTGIRAQYVTRDQGSAGDLCQGSICDQDRAQFGIVVMEGKSLFLSGWSLVPSPPGPHP